MKLRTFRVLCSLCILCTFALSEEIDRENRPVSDSNSQESEEPLTANSPRDKRALGLILSGLAQVFGYAMDPIQIASLPNSDSNEARATNQTSANNQTASTPAASSNSTQSSGSSTTAVPGQRETIRFTGVVNFGNSTNLLTHLQQYETIFHGNSSSTTSSPSSTSLPQMNTRAPTSNQSSAPPFLVRIPIPSASQPPLPPMPQPPLPEIPPQDIMLSYPRPLIPIQLPAISTQPPPAVNNQSAVMMNTQRPVVMRQNMTVRLTVESKEMNNPKDIQKPLPPTFSPSTEEQWKEEYENRLAELERKQEEHARRLMEQELYRNQQQQDNYSNEEDEEVFSTRKPVPKCEEQNVSSEEENDSKGKDEFSNSEKMTESEEEEVQGKYYNKDVDNANQYEDAPQVSENYTSIQYSEPLPLSEDDERRPDELRNSYGQPLHNSELFDNGFVNYFEKFAKPLTDFYSSPESPKEEENSEDSREENERSGEEEDVPARNRYEEYNLEGDGDTNNKDEAESSEDSSEPLIGKNGNVLTKGENKSYFNEEKVIEEMDFSKYMPLIVPVRYLSAPEELKELKPRIEKSEKDNSVAKTESLKKVSSKSRKPKKENLRTAASFPQRRTPKNLHEEGEEKGAQVWPPPFDFVVDSTIHANAFPKTLNSSGNIKISDARRKPQVSKKKKGKRQQQQRRGVIIDNTTRKPYENPEDIYYQDIKKIPQYGTVPGEQLLLNRPVDSAGDAHFEIAETKSDQSQSKEVPDFGQSYRYILNNNYRNMERPNAHIEHPVQRNPLYTNRFESLKRSIEKPVLPTGHYYSEMIYPTENTEQINLKNSGVQNIELVPKNYEQTTIYPRGNRNFFNTGKSVYDFDRGTGNERMFGVFGGDKKIANKASIGLTIPQPDVYVESLTKFASEPESKNEKVRATDYTNSATTTRVMEQEQINPSEPISYIDYPRIL